MPYPESEASRRALMRAALAAAGSAGGLLGAQTLDIADRIVLMQRGRITYEYESEAAKTSVPELMEIVRREYREVGRV
ncbi:MAG: hypothetical protein JOY66_07065 [Acetobacteraceae bacterium]|nr:hypothetical protein [Acetobacteraceae bacterium]